MTKTISRKPIYTDFAARPQKRRKRHSAGQFRVIWPPVRRNDENAVQPSSLIRIRLQPAATTKNDVQNLCVFWFFVRSLLSSFVCLIVCLTVCLYKSTRLSDWVTEWLSDWVTEWLIDWVTDAETKKTTPSWLVCIDFGATPQKGRKRFPSRPV